MLHALLKVFGFDSSSRPLKANSAKLKRLDIALEPDPEADQAEQARVALLKLASSSAQLYEEEIIQYLMSGVILFHRIQELKDVIKPSSSFSRSCAYLSDGVWVWRNDLSYYVQAYHIRLPDEFIAHMREMHFSIEKGSVDVKKLGELFYAE